MIPGSLDNPAFLRAGRKIHATTACVRLAASLIPKEPEAITTPVIERLSDAQLDAMIARCIEGGLDPAAPDDTQIIQ